VSAEYPEEYCDSIDPTEIEDHRNYRKLIATCMIHKCYPQAEGGCVGEDGRCRRNYDSITTNPITHFDDKGFPVYRRRKYSDTRVIPHNRRMLLDWDGHINVEYSGSVYTVRCSFIYE